MPRPAEDPPARAGRREWVGLGVLALPCLLYSMDLTVLYLAIPALTEDLGPSSSELLWITDIYGFLLAGFLITMGNLGDRIGRRRLLLIGAAAFAASSVLAAFAPTVEALIAARALMGVCAATLAPSTLSLIRTMFADPDQRRVAIGVWATSFSVGAAIGPLAGGVLLEFFWWGSVFLLAVPVMLALLAVGPRLLPEYRDPAARRIDAFGAGLSLGAILLVVWGMKAVAEDGPDASALAAVAAGLLAGALFVVRQGRVAHPLIDPSLLRSPRLVTALVAYSVAIGVNFGLFLFLTQCLQVVLGYSPLAAGAWTLPAAAAFVVGALASAPLARRIGPGPTIGLGLLVAAAGALVLGSGTDLVVVVVGAALLEVGIGPAVTLGTDMIVAGAPPERAGAASGVSETGAELGGALGIAVLGSIGVAVYRDEVVDRLPSGLPPADAETARSTVAGAVDVAAGLPAELGGRVLDASTEAFAAAMQWAAGAGAAVALATAVLVLVVLRRPRAERPVAGGP